jgi:hypothetical protein
MQDDLDRFRGWLYAAALYNLVWGATNAAAPDLLPRALGFEGGVLWRAVAMFVLVYAPAFWWAARAPEQHPHVVAVAWLGKSMATVGFVWMLATGALPAAFGVLVLANDVIWLPAFYAYLGAAARRRGGWGVLLGGR